LAHRALRTDWRRRLSGRFSMEQLPEIMPAIRPYRESATGWTRRVDPFRNRNSLALNERGPAPLACKLAKAAWPVMAEQTDYDAKRMFADLKNKPMKPI
jgi:hypothetical protein